ncbi:MAG: DNA repair protein RadA [Mycobacteriaceae bacterium]
MAKTRVSYRCSQCQHTVSKWVGRCPECGTWGTVDEVPVLTSLASPRHAAGLAHLAPHTPAVPISQINPSSSQAVPTGVNELDRVLGTGIVPGSVVLLAGEPGVGKSTLLLEVVKQWAISGRRALYITGEESAGQVRLRAERTGATHDNIYLAAESDLATVFGHVDQVKPSLLIVDSVQTMVSSQAEGVTGGVTQVRAITSGLTALAKTTGVAVLLVGHVTKDGAVAGPRSLEHLVDVVLHFEGDKHTTLRMVRGIKNRFGPADEVGCFELHDNGIAGVDDPSGLFLHERDSAVSGTAVTVTMDGKRPLLGEMQALVVPTHMPSPRRAVSGLDSARVAMILAVLDRRGRIKLSEREVYAATVGGMRMTEPSCDLALAMAVASAYREIPLPTKMVVIGEVGLSGEVRRVGGVVRRVAEAARLGFTEALVPPDCGNLPPEVKRIEVPNVGAALSILGK